MVAYSFNTKSGWIYSQKLATLNPHPIVRLTPLEKSRWGKEQVNGQRLFYRWNHPFAHDSTYWKCMVLFYSSPLLSPPSSCLFIFPLKLVWDSAHRIFLSVSQLLSPSLPAILLCASHCALCIVGLIILNIHDSSMRSVVTCPVLNGTDNKAQRDVRWLLNENQIQNQHPWPVLYVTCLRFKYDLHVLDFWLSLRHWLVLCFSLPPYICCNIYPYKCHLVVSPLYVQSQA